MITERCGYCGAEIVWAMHRDRPRRAPIDAVPGLHPKANIWLVRDGRNYTYHVLEPEVADRHRATTDLHTNHVYTCPAQQRAKPETVQQSGEIKL